MNDYRLGEMEARFAKLIWDNAPIPSAELVRLCKEALGWAKSTTYTMLKRLIDRGIFENENALVTVVITREMFEAGRSRAYVEDAFGGSLPRFLAAFVSGGRISDKEADEIKRLVDAHKGKEGGEGGGGL